MITEIRPNETFNKITYNITNKSNMCIYGAVILVEYLKDNNVVLIDKEIPKADIPAGDFLFSSYTIKVELDYDYMLMNIIEFTNELGEHYKVMD